MAVDRYEIIGRLDAGGMAEVFKGKSLSLEGIEKLVAIKRILPSLTSNQKFVSMFLDEARLSMHLNHANIVQVFDLGKTNDAYFIVMEFIEGCNLKVISEAARSSDFRIPVHQSIYIMMEVCKALSHAHTKKDSTGRPLCIVHRDVSPPNILLSSEGEVKLTDFGLAKAKSQLENTEPGVVKGKFSYLSPEAAYGEEVDQRCDIFAAGIILWELLAGRRLFLGNSDLETLDLVRRCEVPSLSQYCAEATPELTAIVMKALARRVDERYSTAQELGDDLAGYIFRRGLKVTAFDLSILVGMVTSGKLGAAPRPTPLTLIDNLILDQFRSIEASSSASPGVEPAYDGSRPLTPDDLALSGTAPARVLSPALKLEEEPEDDRQTRVEGYGLFRDPPGKPEGGVAGARRPGAEPTPVSGLAGIISTGLLRHQQLQRSQGEGESRNSPAPRSREELRPAPSPQPRTMTRPEIVVVRPGRTEETGERRTPPQGASRPASSPRGEPRGTPRSEPRPPARRERGPARRPEVVPRGSRPAVSPVPEPRLPPRREEPRPNPPAATPGRQAEPVPSSRKRMLLTLLLSLLLVLAAVLIYRLLDMSIIP